MFKIEYFRVAAIRRYGPLAGKFRTVERLSARPPDFQPRGMQAASRSCRSTPWTTLRPLVDALQKALKDPALVNRFAELSMAPVEQERATPAALEALLKSEIDGATSSRMLGITPQDERDPKPERHQSLGISCIWPSLGNALFNRTSLSPSMAASSLPSADAATAQPNIR